MSLSQFTSTLSESFHFLVVFFRRIHMRATSICLDVVETMHQTVVHCTVVKKYQNFFSNLVWFYFLRGVMKVSDVHLLLSAIIFNNHTQLNLTMVVE